MKNLMHFPTIRLGALVKEFGGVDRDAGITKAKAELEDMRGQAGQVIEAGIAALEAIAARPEEKTAYGSGQANAMLMRADQIVTLAGAFGYAGLDEAARCLCDLLAERNRAGASEVASVRVHVRTLRLLAPTSPPQTQDDQDRLTKELARVLTHHAITRAGETLDASTPVS